MYREKRTALISDISGIVTICQGVTASFGGLVACRFLLGVFEAGFLPGEYLMSE